VNSNTDSEISPQHQRKNLATVLRFLVGLVFMVVFWPTALLSVFVISLISMVFLDRSDHRRLGQWTLGSILTLLIVGLELLGVIRVLDEDLKRHADTAGPLIIACNHPALWDAPLVIRRLKRLNCIMKAEVLKNPFLRNGALFAGFLPNLPRLKMIRLAMERLACGERLLLFPEGTRTRQENGVINPFRPGLALLAKHSGAPILPVFISSDSRYLQKGWPFWRMPRMPISISLRVGERIQIQPDEKVRDFSKRLEELFRKKLG
jgi:1-acyl-sn-glycerol-3-phosphate acyltransferase